MVRLVFRPYTQIRRSICTLESLRTSTRVSPGFVLLKHSSPSFGSQHICSHSNLSLEGSWSVDSAAEASYLSIPKHAFTLISRLGFESRTLAHMLDSLVRVSRRVDEKHFVRVVPRLGRYMLRHAFSLAIETSLTWYAIDKSTATTLLPSFSFSAISGTISLSFQSAFHLSLTVLVCYRSPIDI